MSALALLLPSLIGPTWTCERCGVTCKATPAHQVGCAHYRIKGEAWQAKRRELLAPLPVAAVESSGQQGLAL